MVVSRRAYVSAEYKPYRFERRTCCDMWFVRHSTYMYHLRDRLVPKEAPEWSTRGVGVPSTMGLSSQPQ